MRGVWSRWVWLLGVGWSRGVRGMVGENRVWSRSVVGGVRYGCDGIWDEMGWGRAVGW